jgi:hypothetical protein
VCHHPLTCIKGFSLSLPRPEVTSSVQKTNHLMSRPTQDQCSSSNWRLILCPKRGQTKLAKTMRYQWIP